MHRGNNTQTCHFNCKKANAPTTSTELMTELRESLMMDCSRSYHVDIRDHSGTHQPPSGVSRSSREKDCDNRAKR